MDDGSDPITDDEYLYRRIPVNPEWFSPKTGLTPLAFAPHRDQDVTGLSLVRAKHKSIKDAAKGRAGKSYFVAVLQAGKLRALGIQVLSRPEPDNPGHSELPCLNSANRKESRTEDLQRMLVEITERVDGPFASFDE